ncbi:uncharacterized protein AC631_05385 [Debaryomyces fabryi]|uniref:Protein SCD6 n=1 Tax=Debaryomyces fabryi TaxID=58627 RepID=A0A0V1PRI8_9ASCO|nr:uncharacterized protein AC631_05385 [Debaryomyces fabryi]KRZ98855.1 hypothetical protein AC631_05385 [Debaryomyces fabryi]CUM46474.1 unnamed protein product [Debaryomyces fabryi]
MSQYIGKTISLISNKGLRYVGLLDNINADDATVALKSVRSFGTEGRMAASGNANLEVHPGTDVYDYVVFRGSDVKDLTVLDTPIDQVKPEPYTQAPAAGGYPAYQQQPQTQTQQQQNQSTPGPTATSAAPAQAAAVPTQTAAPKQRAQRPSEKQTQPQAPTPSQTQQKPQPQATPTSDRAEETKREEAASPAQPRPQEHPQSGLQKNASKVTNVPETAFDFESANAKFSRDLDSEKEAEQPMYNKQSSFFDNISSSADEKNTMRWAEEKSLNLDTFGESSVNHRGRGRGRGRGNWRGGRGNWRGGRGRGRGGNRSNNDYNNKPEWA